MRRSLRYLRIAFSATCLIACVLLIVLWVRSYLCWDEFTLNNGVTNFGSKGDTLHWFHSAVPIYDTWWVAVVPYLLAAATAGAASIVPWMRWRFSLRTLLIATTLVAVVLGLAVWGLRK